MLLTTPEITIWISNNLPLHTHTRSNRHDWTTIPLTQSASQSEAKRQTKAWMATGFAKRAWERWVRVVLRARTDSPSPSVVQEACTKSTRIVRCSRSVQELCSEEPKVEMKRMSARVARRRAPRVPSHRLHTRQAEPGEPEAAGPLPAARGARDARRNEESSIGEAQTECKPRAAR